MKLEIDKRWKYAAMDMNGDWHAYDKMIIIGHNSWGCKGYTASLNNLFTNLPTNIPWQESLHEIIDGELRKVVDVPVAGEKVMVFYNGDWRKRYSAGKLTKSGDLIFYLNGSTPWSSLGGLDSVEQWRRPTPEEAAE